MKSFYVCSLFICFAALSIAFGEQSDDPFRPTAIKASHVPVVPREMIQKLNAYQNMRSAEFSGWSPSGKGILIRTRFGNAAQLHRVYVPGGRREQITFFEEPVNGRFVPKKHGTEQILLSMSSGGNEQYQLHSLEPEQFRTRLLTNGKARYSAGDFNNAGTQFILSSTERNGRDTDLYIATLKKTLEQKMLWQTSGEFWSAADWSADERSLLMNRFVSVNESYPALLDIATGKKTDIPHAEQGKAACGALRFDPTGKYIYLTSDSGSEFRRLARLTRESMRYDWLTSDIPWDVVDLDIEEHTGIFAAVVNDNGASRLFLFSPSENDRLLRREVKLPLGIISGIEFSPDGSSLGFTLSLANAPSDAYSIDIASHELTRWTFSETGGIDPKQFVMPEHIQFTSFDKREIPAYYYRPQTSLNCKRAVLIMVHGGPEGQFQPYFSPTIQYYVNELGLAVIAPNVRGSSGYGKTYLTLDNGQLREDSVKDIGALLDWIATQPELDSSRVAIAGGSYGGYMTLASLVHYGNRFRAGIDTVGIANFLTFLESTAAYRVDLRRVEYGDERDPAMRQFLEKISPVHATDKISAALMVVHGQNDPRVPVGEALQIAEKVRQQGGTVWTVIAENEGHGFSKRENASYTRTVEALFLKEKLELSPIHD
jgi:dipeptidyl aminopeptidase/acylaminoacyl peptidase